MEKIITKGIAERNTFNSMEEERFERKSKLASAFRVFANYGYDEGVVGQISARDPEFTNTFWVNPFGMYFGHITVSDLIRVDMEGNIVEGKHKKVNKPAFIILSKIHAARPEINSVAHTHTIYGRIFSTSGKLLKPLTIEATQFYSDHSIFNSMGGLILNQDEGDMIAQALGKYKAVILRNHGLLTVGTTVDEAAWWFVCLERNCQIQITAELLGKPEELSAEEAERGFRDTGHPDAGYFQYQPLYQKMLKLQPDFLE
jgi:ribulose-5-phosphate 4-epimerase/fuculose-1-phosphate aldolase